MAKEKTKKEETKISGDKIIRKIKELAKEGNARNITIKKNTGKTLVKIPLLLTVAGALLIPYWIAIGAIIMLATKHKIVMEKK